jgi:threonine dehydrogenase-like Zn-dependent dehydrogenase
MKALQFERSIPKFAAARIASMIKPGNGAARGPLSLDDMAAEVVAPGADWVRIQPRLAGICGSDLATVDGRSSRYFESIVSFPFTPGHEVVADLDGARVVLEPVLGCVARGITPVCVHCASGNLGRCDRISFGGVSSKGVDAGLQSGFCCSTGGGWSTAMMAHRSQLHAVPTDMTDQAAVMVEPTACGIHAAFAGGDHGGVGGGAVVAVLGAGTLGLTVVAALSKFNPATQIIVGARYPEQMAFARQFGATSVVEAGSLRRAVRLATKCMAIGDGDLERLTGGADVVYDCVGSSASISDSLAMVRPGGRIVLVGMPATVKVDLTSLWHREVSLVGAYAYGIEPLAGGRRTFDLAFELVAAHDLGRLVGATYPLSRYTDALSHAANAGRRGTVKVAFDMRDEKARNR